MFLIFAASSPAWALWGFLEEEGSGPIETNTYTVTTEDNWELSITRFKAGQGASKKKKAAVILCHGFNLNERFWDLDSRSSLARFLAKSGYDVWTPSLRGSGQSSKPFISNLKGLLKFDFENIPRELTRAPLDIAKFDWTIDDHINKDAPTIIDFVKKESGFKKVFWIGHSMGGIIMYGYLEKYGSKNIAGFIPMSSMIIIPDPLNPHLELIANQKPLMNASLIINTGMAGQLRNATLGAVKHPIEDLLLKRENMHEDVIFRLFRLGIDDTAPGVISQFSDSIRTGSIISRDGKFNYTQHLPDITAPILIMAGGADDFLTEDLLLNAYNTVSSRDKNIRIFSTQRGFSTDYGHCDLVLGKNSEKEVYPVIAQWLDERYFR